MANSRIQCQICCSTPRNGLSFLCPTCARNLLYEPRLRNAQALLSKETISQEVRKAFPAPIQNRHDHTSFKDEDNAVLAAATFHKHETTGQEAQQRVRYIRQQVRNLGVDIEDVKIVVARAKSDINARKQALRTAQQDLSKRHSTEMDPVKQRTKQAETTWTVVQNRTADVKLFLCKELASLYGLVQRRRKGYILQDQYLLGQIPIVDLRDLNSTSPSQITVSAGHVAHFVYLASHYLSVRLPAEVVLPTASCHYASIIPPVSSYRESNVSTGNKAADATNSSIRPRVLAIAKPLPVLASEDPLAYSLFIEGMTLLAWNIAWLGRTQGVSIGNIHWEEICAIGSNLDSIFGRKSRSTPENRGPSETVSSPQPQSHVDSSSKETRNLTRPGVHADSNLPKPGHLSHDSSRSFICASVGVGGAAELMKSWQYTSPYKLIEKVKGALASERMGAEWELLDKGELEDQPKNLGGAK